MILISVIVLVRAIDAPLSALIDSLNAQTISPHEFEVIIVGSEALIGGFTHLDPSWRMSFIPRTNVTDAAARECGVNASTGQYCLFLDPNVIAGPDLVASHLRHQFETHGSIGVGMVDVQCPPGLAGFVHWYIQKQRDRYDALSSGRRNPDVLDCISMNLCVPRRHLDAVGGFAVDLTAGEDIDLSFRLQLVGLEITAVTTARVHLHLRDSFKQCAARVQYIGARDSHLYRRHPLLLHQLELGRFEQTSRRAILLRRLLLTTGCSHSIFQPVAALIRSQRGKQEWYQFVASFLYWRGVQHTVTESDLWWRLTHGIPILMYHAIGYPDEPSSRYIVPVHRFRWHMRLLRLAGYTVLELDSFLDDHGAGRLPPARSALITFDDGYTDNYDLAYPVLSRYHFPATIFLVSRYMGTENQWDQHEILARRRLLSSSNARTMQQQRITFGAHTCTHPRLTDLHPDDALEEIQGSRTALESMLETSIRAFAYPHGRFNAVIERNVQEAGFAGACCSRSGLNYPTTPQFALRRVEIRGDDSILRFVLGLRTGQTRLPPIIQRKRPGTLA